MRKMAIVLVLMLVFGVVFVSGCISNQDNTTVIPDNTTNITEKVNETVTNLTKNKTLNETILQNKSIMGY